jgi:hypothetical protein
VQYTGEGMDEMEFTEAESNLQDLVSECKPLPLIPLVPSFFLSSSSPLSSLLTYPMTPPLTSPCSLLLSDTQYQEASLDDEDGQYEEELPLEEEQ